MTLEAYCKFNTAGGPMRKYYATMIISFMSLVSHSVANAGSCDSVLTDSYHYENRSREYQYAWLSSITETSYAKAKQSAGAAYGSLFSGSYNDFRSKLSQRMNNEQVNINSKEAAEILKVGLTPEQISAWSKCKGSDLELAVTYKDVTADDATLVLSWERPSSFTPALSDFKFDLKNAQINSAEVPEQLDGTTSLLISRTDPKKPIRGTISAKAEAGNTIKNVQAYVFIPAESNVPPKRIIPITEKVYLSIAFWGQRSGRADFPAPIPEGRDLVIIKERSVSLGKHQGEYVRGAQFCDGFHEECEDRIVVQGCYINKDWHKWYQDNVVVYRKEDICEG